MKFLQALLAGDDGHAYKENQYPPLPPPSTRDLTHLLAESPTLLLLFYDFIFWGNREVFYLEMKMTRDYLLNKIQFGFSFGGSSNPIAAGTSSKV